VRPSVTKKQKTVRTFRDQTILFAYSSSPKFLRGTKMRAANRHALSNRSLIVLATVLALAGCSLNTDVSQPASIQTVQGNNQSVATNTKLPTDLGVIVVTQFGEPVAGVAVQWTVTSGGGSVTPVLTQTSDTGIATTSYTSGATPGTVSVEAKVSGLPVVTFTVTVY
jgi:Big-like domain-containing protein